MLIDPDAPAFPCPDTPEGNKGITIRALLAGIIMVGVWAYPKPHSGEGSDRAIECADAIINRINLEAEESTT